MSITEESEQPCNSQSLTEWIASPPEGATGGDRIDFFTSDLTISVADVTFLRALLIVRESVPFFALTAAQQAEVDAVVDRFIQNHISELDSERQVRALYMIIVTMWEQQQSVLLRTMLRPESVVFVNDLSVLLTEGSEVAMAVYKLIYLRELYWQSSGIFDIEAKSVLAYYGVNGEIAETLINFVRKVGIDWIKRKVAMQ